MDASPQLARSLSALLVFALVTFLTVVGGELAPKGIALRDPERTALAVAQPLVWIRAILHPAVTILNGAGAALLRLLGFGPPTSADLVHTVEEIKMLVTASAESGVVEDQEEEMVHAIFDFGETLVRQVMVPRTEMEAVPETAGVPTMLALAGASPHTKFPVYRKDIDQILGVVHVPDLLRATQDPQRQAILASELMREVLFVPESAHVSQLLRRFRARHEQIAIVLDEYGGTAGLITLEDLLEEIVGEVGDPFDAEVELLPQPDGSSLIDGLTSIEEINDRFGPRTQRSPLRYDRRLPPRTPRTSGDAGRHCHRRRHSAAGRGDGWPTYRPPVPGAGPVQPSRHGSPDPRMSAPYAEVALHLSSVRSSLHYGIPDALRGRLQPGHLVVVPLGTRRVQGVVLRLLDEPEVSETKLVESLLDASPVLTQLQMTLADWLSTTYLAPLMDALGLMIPAGLARQADSEYRLLEAQVSPRHAR